MHQHILKTFPRLQSADQICMNHEPVSLSVASLTITLVTIVAQSPVFYEQKIDNLSIMCSMLSLNTLVHSFYSTFSIHGVTAQDIISSGLGL